MSDPRDQLPRIVKSARKVTDPGLDNVATRPRTAIKTVADETRPDNHLIAKTPATFRSATNLRLDNPAIRPRSVAAKTVANAGPDHRLRKVPAFKSAIADARIDARPREQELNERPVSRNQPRPDATRNVASHESLQQTDVSARGPKRVTFNIEDFPLPVERRPVARTRVVQNSGRFNPSLNSSGAQERRASLPSKSASFFPERSSRPGAGGTSAADVPRKGRGRQSTNNSLDQRRATKSQQMRLHMHTESHSAKYARKFEGVGSRTGSRVPRMSSANRDASQDHLVNSTSERSSGSANYVDIGLKLVRETDARVKAARKFQFGRKSTKARPEIQRSATPASSHSSERSDDDDPESATPVATREDSEELEYVDLGIPPHNIARKQTESSSESDVAEEDETPADIPSDTLIQALENISLTTIRLARLHRLPFMLRNLRKGFLSRCKSLGIDPSRSIPPPKPITVVYNCIAQTAEDRYLEQQETRTTMADWRCPLCDLHGIFPVQQMLIAHLQWDHSGVGFWWDMDDYTLWIRLPLTGHVALPVALPVRAPLFPHSRAMTTPSTRTASTEITDFSSNIHDDEYTPATTQSPSRNTSVSSQPFTDADSLDIKPKQQHIQTLRVGSAALSTTRSSSVTSRTMSRASSIHASGKPTPPPQSDPLGPAAQYPYLLKSDGIYSCRVGGPRLYDLLNTLPLDEFGVLAWVILDREEEIFEIDDVRDEDKVMQALWFRWIFLNRNKFVADFFRGTKTFINDNWQMIDRAAGLAALRTWLLVLNINNFLVTSDVVSLLRHYRGVTGRTHWYDDNHAAQNEVAPV
ncbi:hypothetical protein DEU56DRAFT_787230 [Suillus clintonianus]|uniref:uncharacterized protein n=1 Tax=Suillus clintonianus TaxID=1904413 RepID=UPI001B871E9B|nr:uncharacterized protein DEU56DRAFT_787230 [Suillus clintonianus]KAG2146272.1 hypothetical protein DEU56DRAFT_787230 [Suillus clintonianus]